jgi:hypothetical protein
MTNQPTQRRATILLLLGTLGFLPCSTNAQFLQQGSKLVGTGVVGTAWQGISVSISSDGNTAIEGGYQDNNFVGAAWVFTRSGGVWTQQGGKLVGTGAVGDAREGASVSVSSDGNTAIVGGPSDNNIAGAVWVFTRSGGVWTQQGSKLIGTGAVGSARQGISVSISSDGNTAVVCGYLDNNQAGTTWVFTRGSGVWTQQGSKLVGTGAVGAARQGQSVSISSDGNTAIVGGNLDNNQAGAAWVFTRSGGVWTQQGNKLVGIGAVGAAVQGQSVSISSNGNTAIVGGPGDNSSAGAVWVFTRSGGVWTQQGSKLVGTGAVGAARQGQSVSISSDGNTAIVGGPGDNSSAGAVWVFTRSGGVWTQQGNKLVGTGAVGAAVQGNSVSISSDGSTAIEGGFGDESGAGAAWVFVNGQTGVDEGGGRLPAQLALEQNYPNPFNPSTTITYALPRQSHVALTVYNILGQEVVRLLDEIQEPGRKSVMWNGRDAAGSSVSSGVYFYRLEAAPGESAERFAQIRKLMVLK